MKMHSQTVNEDDNNRTMRDKNIRTVKIQPYKSTLFNRISRHLIRKLRGLIWRYRLATWGTGSTIDWPSYITGAESIAVGSGVHIWRHARINAFNTASNMVRIKIGDGAVIQAFAHIGAIESVKIGTGVMIGSHVLITDHDHVIDPEKPERFDRELYSSPVQIGSHVKLHDQVMVLKGVTIGEHSVVAGGSIVTHNIPPFCLVAGSPARLIKKYDRKLRSWVKVSAS